MSETETTEKKRGRETAADMVRSLGLVMVLVVVIWFLAQPPDSDEKTIRVVDPAGSIAAFTADVPGVPVPGGLPDTWRPTSSTLVPEPTGLRVGYVTPSGAYAEYAASTAPRAEYLSEITGEKAQRLGPVDVGGVTYEQYADPDGSISLVRQAGAVTVVVGTLRASAPLDELRTLAASLAAR